MPEWEVAILRSLVGPESRRFTWIARACCRIWVDDILWSEAAIVKFVRWHVVGTTKAIAAGVFEFIKIDYVLHLERELIEGVQLGGVLLNRALFEGHVA